MKHIKTISEFHQFLNLPAPQHPLISVLDVATVPPWEGDVPASLTLDFYSIAVKRMHNVKIKYGQQPFNLEEGVMYFMSPNQVFGMTAANENEAVKKSGWAIYIHPDFIWNTPLAKIIKSYDFWDYSLSEALFLSAKEEAVINDIIQNIQRELDANMDAFSKPIIGSQIGGLLSYADRYYQRQFLTQEKANHQILERLETLLQEYFSSDLLLKGGLPTVPYIAEALHISPKYLSSLLRTLTGQNTQQHIHNKLIEKAKEKLTTTNLTISEIAYELGFEHLQSFSKLFKIKTNLSPVGFRSSFN